MTYNDQKSGSFTHGFHRHIFPKLLQHLQDFRTLTDNVEAKMVILLDGASIHCYDCLDKILRGSGIIPVFLPARTTSLLQVR